MPHNLTAVALLSEGMHPLSLRARRAEQDAQALELASKIGQASGLHAGTQAAQEKLRPYLGMSLAESISLLEISEDADPVLALAAHFKQTQFDVILTGTRAELGESSGMLPYLLADTLGIPVINQVCEVSVNGHELSVTQALPRGARRAITVSLPCILIVDSAAPAARQTAFGPAKRGTIDIINGYSECDTLGQSLQFELAKKKPKRMKKVKAKTAADRFKAATASQAKGGQVLHPDTPEAGAAAIFEILKSEGLVK